MTKIPLAPRQKEILDYIKNFEKKNKGIMPTIEDVAKVFYINGSTVYEHLKALEKKGWIKKYKFYHRAIEILK